MTAYAEQVEALLDEVGADQALLVGVSVGANVALETAVRSPGRVRGLLLESPVLDNAFAAGLLRLAPLMLGARVVPLAFSGVRRLVRAVPRGVVPFWVGVALDTGNQRPGAVGAMVHGVLFGRMAPSPGERREIGVPTLLVGHRGNPAHPWADVEMLAAELPRASVLRSRGPLEWRLSPARLDGAATSFALDCWDARSARKRRRRSYDPTLGRHNGGVPLYRDEGVVLRTQKLGEADRIITLLTRPTAGSARSARGSGVRRSKFGLPARAVHPRRRPVLRGPVPRRRAAGRDARALRRPGGRRLPPLHRRAR